jgi:phosphoglycolate phosphatase-like HAD superfamily hydrolase
LHVSLSDAHNGTFGPVRFLILAAGYHKVLASTQTRLNALVLFDIDGTLLRRAGPHHREALVEAAHKVTGLRISIDGVPVAGMLDRDILTAMLRKAGASHALIRGKMPEIVHTAQSIYTRRCPDLRGKVCPGARMLLYRLSRRGIPAGLVTGNLTRIGWKKMERAGLRSYLRFGAFAELAKDRAGLVRIAVRHARSQGLIDRKSQITLIGDHPNDIRAAQENGVRSVAVATGVIPAEELARYSPDVLAADMRSLTVEMLVA